MGVKSIPRLVSATAGERWRLGAGAAGLLLTAIRLNHHTEGVGTPKAPFCDALGPWLWGALNALFHLRQIDFLHRPTAGLFWGSIIAITGRIDAIPFVFAALFVVASAFFLYVFRGSPLGTAYAFWLLFLGLVPEEVLWSLLPMTLLVDLAAFALTVIGTTLLIGSDGLLACVAAGVAFGVAASVRGLMMLGGPVLFVLLLPWRRALLVTAVFLLPIAADIALQKAYGVPNNGKELFFCMYDSRFHIWTNQCHADFLREQPGTIEVARHWFAFVTTPKGLAVLKRTAKMEMEPAYPIIVLFVILVAGGLRRRAPLAMFAAYLVCSAFIVAAGLAYNPHYWANFSFLLHLGVLLLVAGEPPRVRPKLQRFSAALLVMFALLYSAWWWWPSSLRRTYRAEVNGRNAAIKISDDPELDRSLYFLGSHVPVYTRSDGLPIGSVRRDATLADPSRLENASFKKPNAFLH